MNRELSFDSIESAQGFVALFAQVVRETKRDIEADIKREMSSNPSRRLDALQIVADKLGKLELHLKSSSRTFNDLRSLRRLLFGERSGGTVASQPRAARTAKTETAPLSPSPRVSTSGMNGSTVAGNASKYAKARKRALSSDRVARARDPGTADAVPWYTRPDFKQSIRKKGPTS